MHPPSTHARSVYRGDWVRGRMHGCGGAIWRGPGGGLASAEDKWFADEFVGDVMPCGGGGAFEAGVDADMAALQARSFQVGPRRRRGRGG